MQIHGQHTIRPSAHNKIRHKLCRDRHARPVFAVLTGIPKKRKYGRDAFGRSAAGGIYQDQQLHDVFVRRRTGGLNNKDIFASDIVANLDLNFSLRKTSEKNVPERDIEFSCDIDRQLWIGTSRKKCHGTIFLFLNFWHKNPLFFLF